MWVHFKRFEAHSRNFMVTMSMYIVMGGEKIETYKNQGRLIAPPQTAVQLFH